MKFIVGVLTGFILGALAAIMYSVSTGRDLREEYAGVRDEVMRRDFESLSNRLEQRAAELQATVQDRMNQMQGGAGTNGSAGEVIEDAKDAAGDAADTAAKAVDDAADAVEDAAKG
jgi:gas vesicle protein